MFFVQNNYTLFCLTLQTKKCQKWEKPDFAQKLAGFV